MKNAAEIFKIYAKLSITILKISQCLKMFTLEWILLNMHTTTSKKTAHHFPVKTKISAKKHLQILPFLKILPDWNVTLQNTALHMITGLRKVLFTMTVQSMKLSKNSRQADIHMNKTALYGSNHLS